MNTLGTVNPSPQASYLSGASRLNLSPDTRQMLEDIEAAHASLAEQEGSASPSLAHPMRVSEPAETVELAVPQGEHLTSQVGDEGHTAHTHHLPHQGATNTLQGAHLALEMVEAAGALGGAIIGGVVGASLVGLGLGALGVAHVRHGVKTKEAEVVAEGASSLLLSARSTANAVALAGELHGNHAMHALAHTAHGFLTPLGILHGAIDIGVGIHATVHGVRHCEPVKITTGALGIGMGTALLIASAGGGLPALGVAGGLLLAKIGVEGVHKWRIARSAESA